MEDLKWVILSQTQQSVAIETSGRISAGKLKEMTRFCQDGCNYNIKRMLKVTEEQLKQINV